MTNAELIAALRYCISDNADDCDLCPYQSDCKRNGTGKDKMIRDVADALEAAEKRIAELEAQIPKEGEWIMDCLAPQMDAHRIGKWAYAPKCSERGTHWDAKTNYCPSCGARMQTVTDCHTLEEGER